MTPPPPPFGTFLVAPSFPEALSQKKKKNGKNDKKEYDSESL